MLILDHQAPCQCKPILLAKYGSSGGFQINWVVFQASKTFVWFALFETLFLGAGVECEIGLVVKTGVGEMKRARCSFGLKTTLSVTWRQHEGGPQGIRTSQDCKTDLPKQFVSLSRAMIMVIVIDMSHSQVQEMSRKGKNRSLF